MTDKEAMKLALFALDIVKIHYTQNRHINEAITALKERLADPMLEVQRLGQEIEQEPVAHLWECLGRWSAYLVNNGKQADCAPPSWLVEAVRDATTPPQRTWIGLEGAEFGWFCHTDFLNARKYTKKQRQDICCQLLSEAQSWDIKQYQLMMHDSTKRPFIGLTDEEQQQAYEQWQNEGWGVFYNAIEAKLRSKNA
jgi:hypothetical protein